MPLIIATHPGNAMERLQERDDNIGREMLIEYDPKRLHWLRHKKHNVKDRLRKEKKRW